MFSYNSDCRICATFSSDAICGFISCTPISTATQYFCAKTTAESRVKVWPVIFIEAACSKAMVILLSAHCLLLLPLF